MTSLRGDFIRNLLAVLPTTETYHCMNCSRCHSQRSESCERILERQKHSEEVTSLLMNDQEMTTITVHPEQVKFTCHKILLFYYSTAIAAHLHKVPADAVREALVVTSNHGGAASMKAFIAWLYSGVIVEADTRETLIYQYQLGITLKSKRYTNDVMYALINSLYENDKELMLSPTEARLLYYISAPRSKIRKFAREHIGSCRPLSRDAKERFTGASDGIWTRWFEEWAALVFEGGAFEEDFTVEELSAEYRGGNDLNLAIFCRADGKLKEFMDDEVEAIEEDPNISMD